MSYAPLALLSTARRSFSRSVSSPTSAEGNQGAPVSPPAAKGQIVLTQPKSTQNPTEYVSAPTPSSLDVKSQRTYEHARQRMKKAADLVKMRAQKTHSPKSLKAGAPAGGMDSILKRDMDIVDRESIPAEKREAWDTRHISDARYEAKLVDLVAAPRPRRQRRGGMQSPPLLRLALTWLIIIIPIKQILISRSYPTFAQ